MEEVKDCFTCRKSMSADDENGEPCLVCSNTEEFRQVAEDYVCDEWT